MIRGYALYECNNLLVSMKCEVTVTESICVGIIPCERKVKINWGEDGGIKADTSNFIVKLNADMDKWTGCKLL